MLSSTLTKRADVSTTTGFLVQLHPEGDPEAIRAALSMIRGVARVDDLVAGSVLPAGRDSLFECLKELLVLERAERGLGQAPCVL